MENPKPSPQQLFPYKVSLEPGLYSWCSCGKSEKDPICDGSHKAEGLFRSLRFEVTEPSEVWLCGCKQTKNPPYCDGSHNNLSE